jgi:hypothetical protein
VFDDTVFGGAKEGMLLTKKGLFGHEIFTDPVSCPLSAIQNIEAHGKDIYINKAKWFNFVQIDEPDTSALCALLMSFVHISQGKDISAEADSSTHAIAAQPELAATDQIQTQEQAVSNGEDTSAALEENKLIKELSARNEYFFYHLFKAIPKKYKIG